MEDLQTKAAQYAAEKTNEAITQAIAQAYIDGYRDGYRDKENATPVNVDNSDDEYVDLGLPSGTLWAADYVQSEYGGRDYMPYAKMQSKGYKLPTYEQVKELFDCCKYKYDSNKIKLLGPNGNMLLFDTTGADTVYGMVYPENVYFWAKCNGESSDVNNAVYMYYEGGYVRIEKLNEFPGNKLPVRLVK